MIGAIVASAYPIHVVLFLLVPECKLVSLGFSPFSCFLAIFDIVN